MFLIKAWYLAEKVSDGLQREPDDELDQQVREIGVAPRQERSAYVVVLRVSSF